MVQSVRSKGTQCQRHREKKRAECVCCVVTRGTGVQGERRQQQQGERRVGEKERAIKSVNS